MFRIRTLVVVICCVTLVSGWKSLMKRLPNGDRVPDPCDPAAVWEGIGHLKPGGYGARNQFGIDFKTHSMAWSAEFCKLDSDKDGRTNGDELGDPGCNWTPTNGFTLMSSNITHPGICEPIDSPKCKAVNTWFWCPDKNFVCAAINEPGTQNFTIKFPKMAVPLNETSHQCMIFDFPQSGDFHIVATTPLLDNTKVIHHMMVFGCKDDAQPEHPVNSPYDCPLLFDKACRDVIAVWTLGSDGSCENKHAGFRIGTKGYKHGGIQLHWENQELLSGEKDGSGMTFYYAANSGRADSGILQVGQDYMVIPPGETTHTETGLCTSDCTRRKFVKPIHITFAFNHMHYLGKSMVIEHVRGGKVLHKITDEKQFIHDHPMMFKYKDPIVVQPADVIRTTCVFNSTSRTKTAMAGAGYMDEMCLGFLTFYPKDAIKTGHPTCIAWKNIPGCHFELDDMINGCDFRNIHNLSNPDTKSVFDRVTKHCRPFGPCFKDCMRVVNDVTKLPCFHGDIWAWSRNKILSRKMADSDKNEWFKFYAGLDSCVKMGTSNGKASFLTSGLWKVTADLYAILIGIALAMLY